MQFQALEKLDLILHYTTKISNKINIYNILMIIVKYHCCHTYYERKRDSVYQLTFFPARFLRGDFSMLFFSFVLLTR